MEDLAALGLQLKAAISAAADLDQLEKARLAALGRKGRITELMKGLGAMDAAHAKIVQEANGE